MDSYIEMFSLKITFINPTGFSIQMCGPGITCKPLMFADKAKIQSQGVNKLTDVKSALKHKSYFFLRTVLPHAL